MLQDRFLGFVNDCPDLNKQLTSFAVYNASYDVVFGSDFVKDLVFNEFKQTIFDLLDINVVKEYRASNLFTVYGLDSLFESNFESIMSGSLLEIVDRSDDSISVEPLDIGVNMYGIERYGTLNRFSNVAFSNKIYFYNDAYDVECWIDLGFYKHVPPHYDSYGLDTHYHFSNSDSYNDILDKLESAFSKLCEDEYRYCKVDK